MTKFIFDANINDETHLCLLPTQIYKFRTCMRAYSSHVTNQMIHISKEGKEAVFMKYIPMSLYKQFIIKLIPQIVLNIIMSVFVIIVINTCIKIPIIYSIIVFLISLIINII